MTQFGVMPRSDGPLGKRLGWRAGRVSLPRVSIPEPVKQPDPVPLSGAACECLALRRAMANALAGHPDTERIRRAARQVALVCIAQDHGREMAAKEMSTLPEAVDAARQELAPIIARDALEIACDPDSFRAVFAALVDNAEQWGLRDLAEIAAKMFDRRLADMCSQRRTRRLIWPRHVGMWLCRRFTGHSLPGIGRVFGNRDHTTVLHACRKIEAIVERQNLDGGDSPEAWARIIREALEGG